MAQDMHAMQLPMLSPSGTGSSGERQTVLDAAMNINTVHVHGDAVVMCWTDCFQVLFYWPSMSDAPQEPANRLEASYTYVAAIKTQFPGLQPNCYRYIQGVHVAFEGQIACMREWMGDHLLVMDTAHGNKVIGSIDLRSDDNSIADTSKVLSTIMEGDEASRSQLCNATVVDSTDDLP
jgi:hypothetical protein